MILATRNVTKSQITPRLSPILPKIIEDILDKVLCNQKNILQISGIHYQRQYIFKGIIGETKI